MNILLVHGRRLSTIPPIRSLIIVLLRNGHHVTVIAQEDAKEFIQDCDGLKTIVLPKNERNFLVHTFSYFIRRNKIRKIVKQEMQHNDVLWTTVDSAVRDVGHLAFRYKHIMLLTELLEDIPSIPIEQITLLPNCVRKLFPMNLKKYASRAFKVAVSEYNRAHIQKAWWDLEKLPEIWPNKPVDDNIDFKNIPEDVAKVISEMKQEKRKIILYQGVFLSDRDLDVFAKAIDMVQDKYCLYLMGRDTPYREKLCKDYKNIKYIPFIMPPYHLLITQWAYVGLLPYKYTHYMHLSVLNALYCAPNKIFEYAKHGVPMLGTDVPGLKMPFSQYHIGYCCKENTPEAVLDGLRKIEENYSVLRANCKKFYDSINLYEIAEKILHEEHESE